MLNHIEHSHLARRLIVQVGGLESASAIAGISQGVLSTYQNPNRPETMTGKVISALQIAAGTSLYSDAQRAEVDQPEAVVADPMRHACDLMKEAAEVLAAVQGATSDGQVSATDFATCDRELADLEEQIGIIRKALRGAHQSGSVTTLRQHA